MGVRLLLSTVNYQGHVELDRELSERSDGAITHASAMAEVLGNAWQASCGRKPNPSSRVRY
jgi:hypothetical protein